MCYRKLYLDADKVASSLSCLGFEGPLQVEARDPPQVAEVGEGADSRNDLYTNIWDTTFMHPVDQNEPITKLLATSD